MISLLELIYFIVLTISVILFVVYVYTLVRKQSGFKYFLLATSLFIINILIGNKLSDLIINEITSEISNSDKVVFINKNKNRITLNKDSSDLLVKTSSQKHSEKQDKYYLSIFPKNINVILKEDSKFKGKFWIKYTKYYFSMIKSIGYLELKS